MRARTAAAAALVLLGSLAMGAALWHARPPQPAVPSEAANALHALRASAEVDRAFAPQLEGRARDPTDRGYFEDEDRAYGEFATLYSETVVVMIAIGRALVCQTAQVETALWSLLGPGAWRGAVHILTDFPACIDVQPVVDTVNSKDGVVPDDAGVEGARASQVRLIEVKHETKTIRMKYWKVRPFHEDTEHTLALYIDVDVLVRAPLGPFLWTAVDAMTQAAASGGSTFAALCAPEGTSQKALRSFGLGTQVDLCHTGVLVSMRGVSDGCHAAWARELLKARMDQGALTRALRVPRNACRVARLDPRTLITFPNTTSAAALEHDVRHSNLFLHATRTYRVAAMARNNLTELFEEWAGVPLAYRGLAPRAPRKRESV